MARFNISVDLTRENPLVPRFRLSNWQDGSWVQEEGGLRQTRDRHAEIQRRREGVLKAYGEPHSWIRLQNAPIPALSIGDTSWTEYVITVQMMPLAEGRCGVAFRWEDARHYYVCFLEPGLGIAVYLRNQDDLIELGREEGEISVGQSYELTLVILDDFFRCHVSNGPTVDVINRIFPSGGVGILAEVPALYHSLSVESVSDVPVRQSTTSCTEPRIEKRILLSESAESIWRILNVNKTPRLFRYRPDKRTLTCLSLEGEERYRIGSWEHDLGSGGDLPFQVFDLDGDGRDELVLAADYRIRVHDAETGDEKQIVPTPDANPYGEGAGDRDEFIRGDAICPVRYGNEMRFYIKDRYWNIHLYNNQLELLASRALNTGHFPLPVDIDGSGKESILACHTLLSPNLEPVWEIPIDDHFDSIAYMTLDPETGPQFYVAAGEEGLLQIDPATGRLAVQRKWGHVQSIHVGRFRPGNDAPCLLVNTLWREPGIHYLVDEHLEEIARWENVFRIGWTLPWGNRDLLLSGRDILDPLDGRLLYELPVEVGEGTTPVWVTDWTGLGNARIAVFNPDEIVILAPSGDVPLRSCPVRPIYSNYLPRGAAAWTEDH